MLRAVGLPSFSQSYQDCILGVRFGLRCIKKYNLNLLGAEVEKGAVACCGRGLWIVNQFFTIISFKTHTNGCQTLIGLSQHFREKMCSTKLVCHEYILCLCITHKTIQARLNYFSTYRVKKGWAMKGEW